MVDRALSHSASARVRGLADRKPGAYRSLPLARGLNLRKDQAQAEDKHGAGHCAGEQCDQSRFPLLGKPYP